MPHAAARDRRARPPVGSASQVFEGSPKIICKISRRFLTVSILPTTGSLLRPSAVLAPRFRPHPDFTPQLRQAATDYNDSNPEHYRSRRGLNIQTISSNSSGLRHVFSAEQARDEARRGIRKCASNPLPLCSSSGARFWYRWGSCLHCPRTAIWSLTRRWIQPIPRSG
ncbi:uncharacterized protein BCR38DRAFT_220779 [Pseudomassariella vexata]|uniref:Uncharacterized protein n=1 Tax=Pseudomassariella vexata TaxID=1141098 RepID=A0A1Y2DV51_9PEZI|nr:uncharacterized protein BCR38DRAFT_220779 [Pseudomassariella vexata]ORY63069.1 hypothetical protein BCR38DRAFT_220779 [Pseudomassariella vexata]